jgi:hypothetical protein
MRRGAGGYEGKFMKHLRYVPALLLLCCLLALPAFATTNPHINFTSKLLSSDGKPLSGFQLVTFSIHDNADRRGDALWIETLPVHVRENGEYTIELGAGSAGFADKVINGRTLLYRHQPRGSPSHI